MKKRLNVSHHDALIPAGRYRNFRDFIAFPKNNSGRDVMIDAPANIDDAQLEELGIALNN